MEHVHIKYLHRSASNYTDRRVADLYNKNLQPFDLELISTEGQIVKGHRYIVSLLSRYVDQKLDDAPRYGLAQIELKNICFEVLSKVVELMYMREVFVPSYLKPAMVDALKFLKCFDINVLEEEAFKNMPKNPVQMKKPKNTGLNIPLAEVDRQAKQPVKAMRKRSNSVCVERAPGNSDMPMRQSFANVNQKGPGVNTNATKHADSTVNKVSMVNKPAQVAQNLQKKITIVKDGIMQIPNSSVKKMYVAQPNVSNIQASIPPSGRIMKKPIVQPNASNSKDSHVPVCQPSANGNQMVTGMTTDLFKRAGLTITKLSTAKKPDAQMAQVPSVTIIKKPVAQQNVSEVQASIEMMQLTQKRAVNDGNLDKNDELAKQVEMDSVKLNSMDTD